MQAVPKQTKKPSFKCPTFSVPAKPKSEKPATQNTCEEDKEQKKVSTDSYKAKGQSSKQVTPEGDHSSKHVEQTDEKPRSDGDKKSNELVVGPTEHEDIHGVGNSSSEDLHKTSPDMPVEDISNSKAVLSSTDQVEKDNGDILKKKKKTAFKAKAAGESGSNVAACKMKDKVKKKKDVDGDTCKPELPNKKLVKEMRKPVEKREALPVRSLTDEEYTAIFDAAIENAMNLNIEEWEPKVTPPAKVKEPVKKKYSITVGRKVCKTSEHKTSKDSEESCTEDKFPEVPGVAGGEDNLVDDNQQQVAQVEGQIDENNNNAEDRGEDVEVDKENVEKGALDEKKEEDREDDSENGEDREMDRKDDDDREEDEENALEGDEVEDLEADLVMESAQKENETTPAVSEIDMGENQPDCVSTPVKKKKLPKFTKKPKLEPKQLPFERRLEGSMVDKIQQMKKMKKEKLDAASKKRKLGHDTKTAEAVHKKGSSSLKVKNRQKSSRKQANKRQKMQHRELELNGTWVQCCNSTCMKWRYLPDVNDPALIPERWTCHMNTDKKYNSCEQAEEIYDESEHIYTKFAEGSIVWAKMAGYPWWPAMVEMDPDTESFYSIDTYDSMFPTHYHVVFFDDHVSRAWVRTEQIKIFSGDEDNDGILYQIRRRGTSYIKDIAAAKKNAIRALSCTIKERIELFGFAARYKGPWNSNSKVKGKSAQSAQRKKAADVEEDSLDDSTIDDVLDNTEALLDNVEEMLDTLDTKLIDSDADSDFVPDELVVVEKKRKKTEDRRCTINEKQVKKKAKIDCGKCEDNVRDDDEKLKESKFEAEERASPAKVTFSNLNLDSDIFTMEMESQDHVSDDNKDVEPGNDTADVKHGKRNTSKDTKMKATKYKDFVPVGKAMPIKKLKEKEKQRNEVKLNVEKQDDSLMCQDFEISEQKPAVQNEDVEKDKSNENGQNGQKEVPKADTSDKQLDVNSEVEKSEINSDMAENKGSQGLNVVEYVTEEAERNTDCNRRFKSGSKGDEESRKLADVELEMNEKDLIDLDDNEIDVVGYHNTDENNVIVPDVETQRLSTENERTSGQNLEDVSDSEFDLEEHFMYETNTDGSDKVRERNVSVGQRITEVEEDSDPFDLMEE